MKKAPRWLSKAAVLAIHERLLAEHGGWAGRVDDGRLEAALASPVNHFGHGVKDALQLAAAYAHAITRDHPFKDGNKRMALTVCGVFLERNGYRLEATEADAAAAIVALATRELDARAFAAWLKSVCVRILARRAPPTRQRKRTRRSRRP